MKLFWKIYSAVFVSFVLIVIAVSALAIRYQIASATEQAIELQSAVGSVMTKEIEKGYIRSQLPFQSLTSLTRHKSFAFWWIVRPDGRIYLADDVKSISSNAFAYFPQAVGLVGDNAISIREKGNIVYIETFGYGSDRMSFWLGFTTKDTRRAERKIVFATIAYAFVALSVLGLIIYFVINHFVRPIKKLTVAAGEIGSGRLDYRVVKQSNDELGLLAEAFNKMAVDLKQTTTSIENLNHEISQRTQAEQKLQMLNEELEEANHELKNFVYIASHDLREPLRKISAFGAILGQSLKDKLSGDDFENFHFMTDGANRMTKMIEGLLIYSRVTTKAQAAETVDLNEILKQLRQLELSVALEEKHVEIEIPQPLPAVSADPVQIRQLMQNLVANGIKYQKKGDTPHIAITSKPAADGMVKIEITDNGIGIAPEYHQSIFIMFRRLHSRNEYEGTGIGLAVCKKIVERQGGKIGVESVPDKGSTFWFTMPEASKSAEVLAAKA